MVALNRESWETCHQFLEQITSDQFLEGKVVVLGQGHRQLEASCAQAVKQAAFVGWPLAMAPAAPTSARGVLGSSAGTLVAVPRNTNMLSSSQGQTRHFGPRVHVAH